MTFTPTIEQEKAVDLFRSGEDLVIQAGAGTGKTSTLKLIAAAAEGGRGQYIAFNKAIVDDASASMPGNVNCSTAHSLAFRAFGKNYGKRLRSSKRMKSMEIARMLRIDPLVISYGTQRKPMAAGYLAGLVMRGITNFCQSADLDPQERHVPYIDGIDVPTIDGKRTYRNNDEVRAHVLPYMRRAWADLMDPQGQLPYKHDHYLKGWQLSNPVIDADYILFDEAQDANPVILDIVSRQKCQKVYVGDSQQAIYGFTGAVNALREIEEQGGNVAYLSQSFRFGQAIADVANGLLGRLKATLSLTGFGEVTSVVGPVAEPDAILCRTNAKSVRMVLELLEEGRKPALVGGGREVTSFAQAARQLMDGQWTAHPELACFSSWDDVIEYVQHDEQGEELALMVKLIEEFGPEKIIAALGGTTSERDADVTVSTAHKSKGREWGTVKLADDYFQPRDGQKDVNEDELRLLYVSATRAKRELDVTLCPQALRALGEDEDSDEDEIVLPSMYWGDDDEPEAPEQEIEADDESTATAPLLSVREAVVQSWIIHPDWDAETHRGYLVGDAFYPEANVPSVDVIEEWVWDLAHGGVRA